VVYSPGLLPFWLTALGFSLIFAGTGWALLKWTTRPITVRKWSREKSDIILPGDSLSDDSFGSDDLEVVGSQRTDSMRGVEAIFTTDNRPRIKISKSLLVGMTEISVLLIIYASLVREYSASLEMQAWVRANFALGQYLLSYNAVLLLTGLAIVLALGLLSRKQQGTRKLRKLAKRTRQR
jgi:hypothetical protein